jgi:hypothetical protein
VSLTRKEAAMTNTTTRHHQHQGKTRPGAKRTRLEAARRRQARRRTAIGWSIAVVVLAGVVTAMMLEPPSCSKR